ncbi:MAG: hypothetical protein PWR13_580 [Archaeoglobi archaeon]|nr:AzlD domain-containing protein [Candidatus Mnemosynella bozhongmuii]MDK2781552.1 hypothetical protein [Archaeoglobi archaeon]
MEKFIIILLMALATYLPRLLPLIALGESLEKETVKKWLSLIPSAILSSLLVSSILIRDSEIFLVGNTQLFAIIPTMIVALKTKSLVITVIAGILIYFLLSKMLIPIFISG